MYKKKVENVIDQNDLKLIYEENRDVFIIH
ncbi:hypothetical protein ES703_32114 [subsurface metagenome]